MGVSFVVNEINILEAGVSIVVSVFLVYLFEWLKKPTAEIKVITPLLLKDNRKLLKVKVVVTKTGFLRRLFPWQNPATHARIRGQIIEMVSNKEVLLKEFIVKWDSNPEPLNYSTGETRPELLSATSAPENLLVGDEQTAAVAVKRSGESDFYIYDGNYYFNPVENCFSDKRTVLRLIFSSTSVSTTKDFLILNPNSSVEGFDLKVF